MSEERHRPRQGGGLLPETMGAISDFLERNDSLIVFFVSIVVLCVQVERHAPKEFYVAVVALQTVYSIASYFAERR